MSEYPLTRGISKYEWACNKLNLLQPWFLLLVRLYIGYQAAVAGWAHLNNVDKTTEFFASLHIPMPRANVYIAGTTEFVGGILLAIGLGSRIVAIPFSFNFFIAILSVKLSDMSFHDLLVKIYNDQDVILKDTAFPFLFVGLLVLIFGPGCISIDGLLRHTLFKRTSAPN